MTSTAPVGDVASVRFTLFGGVRAWLGEVEVPLGPPRQRALLQLLLVASGEPVSLGEILTALWVVEPAASATNQVHRHVGKLRRRFEPELGRREVAAGCSRRAPGTASSSTRRVWTFSGSETCFAKGRTSRRRLPNPQPR